MLVALAVLLFVTVMPFSSQTCWEVENAVRFAASSKVRVTAASALAWWLCVGVTHKVSVKSIETSAAKQAKSKVLILCFALYIVSLLTWSSFVKIIILFYAIERVQVHLHSLDICTFINDIIKNYYIVKFFECQWGDEKLSIYKQLFGFL